MASIKEFVFDCENAPELARFWAAAIVGYAVRPYDSVEIERLAAMGLIPETDPTVMVDGPGASLCFQQVTEAKRCKNRAHLDLAAPDRQLEVERLVALGASIQAEYENHTSMLDPEGNEFCVVEEH